MNSHRAGDARGLWKRFAGAALALGVAVSLSACAPGGIEVGNEPILDDEGNPIPSFSQFVDLPIPPGSRMNLSDTLLIGSAEQWTGRLALTSDQPPDAIYEFYQREMPRYMWVEITAVRSEVSILTMSRLDRVATLMIAPESGGSSITITVGPLSPAMTPME